MTDEKSWRIAAMNDRARCVLALLGPHDDSRPPNPRTRANFASFSGECRRLQTGWRRRVDLNLRYPLVSWATALCLVLPCAEELLSMLWPSNTESNTFLGASDRRPTCKTRGLRPGVARLNGVLAAQTVTEIRWRSA